MNVVRLLVVLIAVYFVFSNAVVTEGPSGRSYNVGGVVVDVVAVLVIVAVAWSWRRSRRRTL